MTRLTAAAAVLLAIAGCGRPDEPQVVNVVVGSLPLYHTQGLGSRNDISGAAYLPTTKSVLLIDDGGGWPPDQMPFYVMDPNANFDLTTLDDKVLAQHLALEGASSDGVHVYVTSPMVSPGFLADGVTPDPRRADDRLRALSRFRFDDGVVTDATTILPYDVIVGELQAMDVWNRVALRDPKEGGLNVEGLAASPTPGRLMIGLRSPHFDMDGQYPTNLRTGDAIVLEVDTTTFTVETLAPVAHLIDLGGLGIRSLEYSPTAAGYFVIAGIAEDGETGDPDGRNPDFTLSFWKGPGATPIPVSFPEVTCKVPGGDCFAGLCRPEAIAEVDFEGTKYLFIASEESGDQCAEPVRPYNFLLIELNAPFLAKLK